MQTQPSNTKISKKVPRDILFSPGGLVLIILAVIIEGIDLLPIPFLDQFLEIPLEIIFIFLFKIITHLPLSSCLLPFLIERIPFISDVIPTFLIRLLF